MLRGTTLMLSIHGNRFRILSVAMLLCISSLDRAEDIDRIGQRGRWTPRIG